MYMYISAKSFARPTALMPVSFRANLYIHNIYIYIYMYCMYLSLSLYIYIYMYTLSLSL